MIGIRTPVAAFLDDAAGRLGNPRSDVEPPLRVGIDLGTATIVLTVIDDRDRPVYYDRIPAAAVRDGVVVDFAAACAAVRDLVAGAESALSTTLTAAATAYPPGVGAGESRACRYVLESAGLECRALVDEIGAAQALLGVTDGAVVDVGGGSTGVGTYADGELTRLGDLPGGGHHLNLILAGALGIDVDEAEMLKRTAGAEHLARLRPGIERIAHNVDRLMPARPAGPVHLVGGALMIPGAGAIISGYLDHPVVDYDHALLVTPFGIAFSAGSDGAR
jgi:ethanolamine utilization protein EutJ